MATDEGKVKIEKFDGADFSFWKMQIEDYLYQKKLHQPLTEKKPDSMKDDEWNLLDRQALGVIRLSLSRNVAFNIAKEKTTAGLMKALSSMYEKPSASNKVHLMRRLFTLRMIEGASIAQHINELNIVITQLSSVGIEFDDEVRALILLSSLPDSWSATVTAVSSSSGSTKMKFDDVRDLVLSEEIRRRESGESSSSSVLHTKSRGRNSTRGYGRGHYKNQCSLPRKNQQAKDEANVASTSGGGDTLICSLENKEESWVLDSGASFHATSQKEFFKNYVSGNLEVDDVPESPTVESSQLEEPIESSDTQSSYTPEHHTPTPVLRRSSRPHVPNRRYIDYMLLTDGGEPEDYEEACQTTDASKWELAMKDEMKSLISNQTWEIAKLPMGKKALHNKWVYRVKEEHDGSKRYKARLVVKGFQQKEGIDYNEIFAPVVKHNTIRSVLSIVASEDLYLEQLDVKTAFLHGDLVEEIYMHQPEGFLEEGKENMVCRLKKSLYGLKQAPRQWYMKFESVMHKEGFNKCNADHCCFFKRYKSSYNILLLYVDDMLVAGSDMDEIRNLKLQLSKEFDMKDLGPAKKILGMQITRDKQRGVLQLSQAEYINRVLHRFNMGSAKPVSTPLASHFRLSKNQSPQTEEEKESMANIPYASAIGSLMYAMICTRPDIGHAVGVVSRFMSNPGKAHWEAVKWILRYLRGTIEKCLYFVKGELKVQGYVDADFAGDVDHRRSTTGYIFTVGTGAVSWISRIQKIVALSTTEAEVTCYSRIGPNEPGVTRTVDTPRLALSAGSNLRESRQITPLLTAGVHPEQMETHTEKKRRRAEGITPAATDEHLNQHFLSAGPGSSQDCRDS
ncbi:unnamed protein product [Trifolium pratense]|uniref:Uncharacterized protein n=1 Tax=Trifolium pratense TaxID=57577 RepID=A0ACB0J374_TRIPR|nr:unnamed protein product [Trifolium pratense]